MTVSHEEVQTFIEAERAAGQGRAVILVRLETSPEDIHGMHAAKGILTVRGGMTSHAAVVARGMGRPCVTGAGSIKLDPERGVLMAGGATISRGQLITIDGAEGRVYRGQVPTIHPEMTQEFALLMGWADMRRRLKVRANADTPVDCETAKRFGAEGVGLCRTEHMFFDTERIIAVREMILADDVKGREAALAKLLPMQRGDFAAIFRIMEDLMKWENTNNEAVLEAARREIVRSSNGNPPPILDPFCGGGSIPLNVVRRGLGRSR